MGVILNSSLEPSIHKVWRLIRKGELKAINAGEPSQPRWHVEGKDLRAYLEARYYPQIKSEVNYGEKSNEEVARDRRL